MKHNDLKRKALGLLAVPLAMMSLPALAVTVEVKEVTSSSIYGANYEGTSDDGYTFGFYLNASAPSDVKLCGLYETTGLSRLSVTAPDEIKVTINGDVKNITVNSADFTYVTGGDNSFPTNKTLTDLILPESYTNVKFNGDFDSRLRSFHFRASASIPTIVVDAAAKGNVRLLTSASLVDSYNAALNDKECPVLMEYEAKYNDITGGGCTIGNSDYYVTLSNTLDGAVTYAELSEINGGDIGYGEYGNRVLTIPDNFVVDIQGVENAVTLTDATFSSDKINYQTGSTVADIYVPSTYQNLTWEGNWEYSSVQDRKTLNYHLVSSEVPSITFNGNSSQYINLYVPEDLYDKYVASLDGLGYTIWSEGDSRVTVNVEVPGTLAEVISHQVRNLAGVRELTVTGTPNEDDMRLFRRMPSLEILDLSGVKDVTTVIGCEGLKNLRDVSLPDGIKKIGDKAFSGCESLSVLPLPNSVEEIGSYAFSESGISIINLENVNKLNEGAFANCLSLKLIDILGLTEVPERCFHGCRNLTEINWGTNITFIGVLAFSDCMLTKDLKIPNLVTNIEAYAFQGTIVENLELGEHIANIHGMAFYSTNLKTIKSHTLFPGHGREFSECKNAVLYVPAITLNEYLLSDNYVNLEIKPLDEEVNNLLIDRSYTLSHDTGVADKANMTLFASSAVDDDTVSLTVSRTVDLNLGKYIQSGSVSHFNNGLVSYITYGGAAIIPESVVTADDIEVNLRLGLRDWYFLSFPFDINVKDIKVEDGALWVVRRYSGEDRAKLNDNTWQNMTDDMVLKAGEGYIFSCDKEGSASVDFTFRPATDGNALFNKDAISTPLQAYASDLPNNASWNLVGNTYPAFVNIKGVDFDGPITVWDGGSYCAYSPVDDDYVFNPFQAFFVQRQDNSPTLEIAPEARAGNLEAAKGLDLSKSAAAAPARVAAAPRSLFNFFVKGANGTDRARIVVNESADMAYETNRDASKFMSLTANAPQIFVMNNGSRMAIDERPLGEGVFTLGAYFGDDAEYIFSLEKRNAEGYSVLLTDNLTGITTDITSSSYAFHGVKGTDLNRFTVVLSSVSGIGSVDAEDVKISVKGSVVEVTAPGEVGIVVADIDGKIVAQGKSADLSVELPAGLYVVKAGEKVAKVVVKQ